MAYADKFTVIPVRGERYSDFYTNLERNFGTKDLARLTDEDSVIASLKNILFTSKGERLYNPTFGCNISGLLFENFSKFTADTLKTEIQTAIENFEPRVENVKIYVKQSQDVHNLEVTVFFNTINNPETISVNFLLSRIR